MKKSAPVDIIALSSKIGEKMLPRGTRSLMSTISEQIPQWISKLPVRYDFKRMYQVGGRNCFKFN